MPGSDQRKEERIPAALRVALDGATGITRDVSASGIFFETDASFANGSEIRFTVDIGTPNGQMVMSCLGAIVRVEHRGPRVGVAVKITECQLRPLAGAAEAAG